jgi:hypothetical protein
MFEEIEQNIFINRNFSFLVKKNEFILFFKFLSSDFSCAQKYFENLETGDMPISKLPSYMQEYFALKNYSKKEIRLFKHFLKKVGTELKFNLFEDFPESGSIRSDLFNTYKKYNDLIVPKILCKKMEAELSENSINCIGENYTLNSSWLARHYKRYSENNKIDLWLYLVSLGSQLEEQVKKLNDEEDVYAAYILHSIGTGFTEAVVEDLNLYMDLTTGKHLKRFSPGYEDWDIAERSKILNIIKFSYEIGLNLSETYAFQPEQSSAGLIA